MVKVRSSAQPLTIKTTVSSHSLISFSCTQQRKWHDPDVQPQLWFYKPCQTFPICSRLLLYEQALLVHCLLHASASLHATLRAWAASTRNAARLLAGFLRFHSHYFFPFFLAVLADCLNAFAVGAPFDPGFLIVSPEPALMRFLLA
jgi:hypothetical protein